MSDVSPGTEDLSKFHSRYAPFATELVCTDPEYRGVWLLLPRMAHHYRLWNKDTGLELQIGSLQGWYAVNVEICPQITGDGGGPGAGMFISFDPTSSDGQGGPTLSDLFVFDFTMTPTTIPLTGGTASLTVTQYYPSDFTYLNSISAFGAGDNYAVTWVAVDNLNIDITIPDMSATEATGNTMSLQLNIVMPDSSTAGATATFTLT